jgi:predicted Zn-dependent protease
LHGLYLGTLLLWLGVGCGTLSVSDEQDLGDRFEREVRREYRFVGDRVVNDYVARIGNDILRTLGPQPFDYSFQVVDHRDINAFAAPGGHIYVHTGTILKARDVSELAGVIAHEIGHVNKRHIAQNYEKQRAARVGQQAAVIGAGILGGGAAAGAANLATGLGLAAVLNSFGREAEREADDFAVHVLPQAGYDPRGLPSFFETLIREGGPKVPQFLSSHPAPADRLETTRAAIAAEALPPGLRTDDGGRLEIIQQRIELLTKANRRPAR